MTEAAPSGVTNRLVRSLGMQGVWRLASIAIGFINIGLVARYLNTSGYGQLSTLVALFAMFAVLTDFGTNNVVLRRANVDGVPLDQLVRQSLGLTSFYALPLAATFMLAGVLAYNGDDYHLLRPALPAFAVGLVASAFASSLRPLYQQQVRLAWLAACEFAVSLASLMFYALIVTTNSPPLAMFYVQGIGPVVLLIGLWFGQRQQRLLPLLSARSAFQLLRASATVGFALLIGTLYIRIDVLLLSLLTTQGEVGEYGLAARIATTLSIVSVYVSATLYPELARLHSDRQRYGEAFTRSVAAVLTLALPLGVGLALVAAPVVTLVGGAAFDGSAAPLAFLSLSLIPVFVNGIIGSALVINDKAYLFLRMSIICLIVNVVGNFILIPRMGATGAALTKLATECLTVVVASYWLRNDLRIWFWPTLTRLTIATVVMAIAVHLAAEAQLGVRVLLGISTYAVAAFLLRLHVLVRR